MAAEPTAVLIHSPLLGPLSWSLVADALRHRGSTVVVPDLRAAVERATATPADVVAAAATEVRALPAHTVLVGHSGAGPLLPAIAGASGNVSAAVYVDAGLAHPGQSWSERAPADLVAQLTTTVDRDGRLPVWTEWFAPGEIRRLIGDLELERALHADLPRLWMAYLRAPHPLQSWDGPAGYLQLSAAYRGSADAAAALGVPVRRLAGHHLAVLTDPERIADELRTLIDALDPADGRR